MHASDFATSHGWAAEHPISKPKHLSLGLFKLTEALDNDTEKKPNCSLPA